MLAYQSTFLQLCIRYRALKFGQFTLKSGRVSPYFFNAGAFYTGTALAALGECYAEALLAHSISFDVLFGPAYKGIPVVCSIAMALARRGMEVPYCFNRKEAKTHGEGGNLVGAPVVGRVVIIDDVITAGTAIRGVVPLLQKEGAEIASILLALDRQERGQGNSSAVVELAKELKVPIYSMVNMDCLISYVKGEQQWSAHTEAMEAYRAQYQA